MAYSHSGGATTAKTDFAPDNPGSLPLQTQSAQQSHPSRFTEGLDTSQQGSSIIGADGTDLRRHDPSIPQSVAALPSRGGGTLKKKRSLSRKGSVKRSSSKRASRSGSLMGIGLGGQDDYTGDFGDEMNSAFFTPVPVTGNPTEILANRFQSWRKVLKDLITYFRDIQKTYEARSKSLYTLSNVINNINTPPMFLAHGGIGDAIEILRNYHKQAISEGAKAKSVEEDVILQLTGLRSDLQLKIKEIKGLSGDFKNNVEKETEATKRAVQELQNSLLLAEADPNAAAGKGDPFIVKIGVDRQLLRQIDEENYLHRAFLNLESSGRELESIVVGEIQKAYNAYAAIIKREADDAYDVVERLQSGPIVMPKDYEWEAFVDKNEHFIDPRLPVRKIQNITYPGKDNPAAAEVRSGMLERKSKYLKSYTPGWYVLSPTHLHEFKSPDRIMSQAPVMSLYLADQKLGSHSSVDSSSHKFMLKGRQTGGVHRGHAWVFRAESHDTMLAWYEDIKSLTEKTGEERTAFIRQHARSLSAGSNKAPSVSDDGALDEDEADEVPYSATASQVGQSFEEEKRAERPIPGGRFPSALTIDRNSQLPPSPSSSGDRDVIAAAVALPNSSFSIGEISQAPKVNGETTKDKTDNSNEPAPQGISYVPAIPGSDPVHSVMQKNSFDKNSFDPAYTHTHNTNPTQAPFGSTGSEYYTNPAQAGTVSSDEPGVVSYGGKQAEYRGIPPRSVIPRHDSKYGDWMAPAAAGFGGLAVGSVGIEVYKHHQDQKKEVEQNSLGTYQDQRAETESIQTQRHQDLPDSQLYSSQISALPIPPGEVSVPPILPAEVAPEPIAPGPVTSFPHLNSPGPTAAAAPKPISNQPLPPNIICAPKAGGVIDSNQLHREDNNPAFATSNQEPSFPVNPDLDAFPEQSPSGTAAEARAPRSQVKEHSRPGLKSHASENTISDLHIPGEFPRNKYGPESEDRV